MSADGFLDTNTIILFDAMDPGRPPTRPTISAIMLAELSLGPLTTDDPVERARRQIRLQETERSLDALPFDTASARAFTRVAADLRRHGRKTTARAYDALLAATGRCQWLARTPAIRATSTVSTGWRSCRSPILTLHEHVWAPAQLGFVDVPPGFSSNAPT